MTTDLLSYLNLDLVIQRPDRSSQLSENGDLRKGQAN